MGKDKQLLLSDDLKKTIRHGGDSRKGKRKVARPIATKQFMHVTMRSSLARGRWSLLHHEKYIQQQASTLAKRFGLILYRLSNAGNHLHMMVKPRSREALRHFLSALSGRICQRVTGARKGKPLGKRFFDYIPWSRIITGGLRDFEFVEFYLIRNELETSGEIPYVPRKKHKPKPPPRPRIASSLRSSQ